MSIDCFMLFKRHSNQFSGLALRVKQIDRQIYFFNIILAQIIMTDEKIIQSQVAIYDQYASMISTIG